MCRTHLLHGLEDDLILLHKQPHGVFSRTDQGSIPIPSRALQTQGASHHKQHAGCTLKSGVVFCFSCVCCCCARVMQRPRHLYECGAKAGLLRRRDTVNDCVIFLCCIDENNVVLHPQLSRRNRASQDLLLLDMPARPVT